MPTQPFPLFSLIISEPLAFPTYITDVTACALGQRVVVWLVPASSPDKSDHHFIRLSRVVCEQVRAVVQRGSGKTDSADREDSR